MSSMNVQEQWNKMPLGEKIILPAALVLLIDSFLKWYSAGGCISTGFGGDICASVSRNAWQSPGAIWGVLAVLCAIAMGVIVVLTRFVPNMKLPALPQGVTWARVQLGLAAAAALFVIIKLLNHSGDLSYGFFIGIVCVAALVAGGYLLFQAEGGMGSSSSAGTSSTPGSTM